MSFKTCQDCEKIWNSRDEFITDAKITLTGYQANFDAIEKGLFLFEHTCGATISLVVTELADLYGGQIYETSQTGSAACPGYCLHVSSLKPCPEKCECAYVREILELLQYPQ